MRYETPKGLALLLPVALMTQGCALFASAQPIASARSACSSLLPDEWREGVPGADLPQGNTVGDWIAFGDAQTGQLDKSNDRYRAAVGIVERCEVRDREAIAKSRKKFLGIF